MGRQSTEEQPISVASESNGLLWSARLEHYHSCFDTAHRVLPLPIHRVLLRGVEARIQDDESDQSIDSISVLKRSISGLARRARKILKFPFYNNQEDFIIRYLLL